MPSVVLMYEINDSTSCMHTQLATQWREFINFMTGSASSLLLFAAHSMKGKRVNKQMLTSTNRSAVTVSTFVDTSSLYMPHFCKHLNNLSLRRRKWLEAGIPFSYIQVPYTAAVLMLFRDCIWSAWWLAAHCFGAFEEQGDFYIRDFWSNCIYPIKP